MSAGTGKRDTMPALFRVGCIFIIDFIISLAWSIVALRLFGIFILYRNGIESNELHKQMLESPEYLFIISMYNIFTIIMTYLFWKFVDKRSTEVIGLRWKKNSLKMFGLGLLGGSLEIILIILLSLGMGTLWFQGSGFGLFSTAEIQRSLFYGFLTFLLVGFGEEVIFRGYIQKRLMLSLGNKRALIISSLIFMAAHILTYGKLLDFIDVALGGAILGYLYILTDSLYLSAAYHFIYDLLQVNIVKLQDYEYYKGAVLYIFKNSGDVLVSGIDYGNVIEISFIIAELAILLLLFTFRAKITRMSLLDAHKENIYREGI